MTDLLILLAGVALVLAWLALLQRHQSLHDREIAYRRWSDWEWTDEQDRAA